MHPVSCTNSHDVTDLVNHGMVKNKEREYLENRTYFSTKKKNLLTFASDDTNWEVIFL